MTKRTRTILFSICLLLFVLLAPTAVLYSQGYRIDLESKKLTQTGGLFVKALPKQADIYINNELNKRTDFFFGSALIENLLPKDYKIEIKKDGYHAWEKTLPIKEKQVQEARNIILFPQNIKLTDLSNQVTEFWLSPDSKKIVALEQEKEGWALKLYDLDKNIKSHLISELNIFAQGGELLNLTFSEDGRKLNLKTGSTEKIKYFTLEIDKTKLIPAEVPAPLLTEENILAQQKVNGDTYHLDQDGHLLKNEEILTLIPFPVKQETKYNLYLWQNHIFLQEAKALYQFNDKSKEFDFFFDGLTSFKISPDHRKLAYFSEQELWILFLEDTNELPTKKSGDKILLTNSKEKLTDIFWLNNDYLLFATKENASVTELDDRDKLNIIDILKIKELSPDESIKQISWNQSNRRLYLLIGETLYGSDVLLP
jgi:hypothetical protein